MSDSDTPVAAWAANLKQDGLRPLQVGERARVRAAGRFQCLHEAVLEAPAGQPIPWGSMAGVRAVSAKDAGIVRRLVDGGRCVILEMDVTHFLMLIKTANLIPLPPLPPA